MLLAGWKGGNINVQLNNGSCFSKTYILAFKWYSYHFFCTKFAHAHVWYDHTCACDCDNTVGWFDLSVKERLCLTLSKPLDPMGEHLQVRQRWQSCAYNWICCKMKWDIKTNVIKLLHYKIVCPYKYIYNW
jgi:hypothetical protein